MFKKCRLFKIVHVPHMTHLPHVHEAGYDFGLLADKAKETCSRNAGLLKEPMSHTRFFPILTWERHPYGYSAMPRRSVSLHKLRKMYRNGWPLIDNGNDLQCSLQYDNLLLCTVITLATRAPVLACITVSCSRPCPNYFRNHRSCVIQDMFFNHVPRFLIIFYSISSTGLSHFKWRVGQPKPTAILSICCPVITIHKMPCLTYSVNALISKCVWFQWNYNYFKTCQIYQIII